MSNESLISLFLRHVTAFEERADQFPDDRLPASRPTRAEALGLDSSCASLGSC